MSISKLLSYNIESGFCESEFGGEIKLQKGRLQQNWQHFSLWQKNLNENTEKCSSHKNALKYLLSKRREFYFNRFSASTTSTVAIYSFK